MLIKFKYCRHMKKDGTFTNVSFDTDRKVFTKDEAVYELKMSGNVNWEQTCFVEAAIAIDVKHLIETLIADGYKELS